MATTETPQLPDGYFVADDADGDVWLWKGDRDGECYPVVWQRGLDNEDPALWPALLRGLGSALADSREG